MNQYSNEIVSARWPWLLRLRNFDIETHASGFSLDGDVLAFMG